MTEDQKLLQQYTRGSSTEALNELIRRHRDLVYSSALRQVRDAHLAEDVTQAVFIVLSKKASTIRQGVATGGWLLAVTRRAALNAMKKQAIQHRHERAAAKMEAVQDAEAAWEKIDPMLDSVMTRLSRKDRDAVVLRFFQDRSFAQVGQELGLSEDAARKRVARALEKLRGLLGRRGASLESIALATLIATRAVRAAPIAANVTAASSGVLHISKEVIDMMTWTKIKLAAAIMGLILIAGGAAVVTTAPAQQSQKPADQSAAPANAAPIDVAAARDAFIGRL